MERPFATPHPSIQTQDQIFKLPSSKPCYSPNLSPLPLATTRSKFLKENRVSIRHRSASVHSSSSTKTKEPQIRTAKRSLKANMKPRFSKPKTVSRSGINLERALASPFVSRASSPMDNQSSNTNPNDPPPPKPRLGKRGLSDTFYNSNLPFLGSQSYITENIHEILKGRAQTAHTSPSSNGPPSVLLNLNTQLKQKRRKGGHRGTVSVDDTGAIASYPQDLLGGTTTKKIREGRQRERRTSAPSTYSRRPRSRVLPLLVGAPVGLEGNKTRRSRLASGLEIIYNVNDDGAVSTGAGAFTAGATNHADDDGFVLPLLSHLHNKNITANSAESEMDMDWRVGMVDFNRPPSQMCHYPTTAMLSGWGGGDVFSSSGSEGSSSESEEEDDGDKGLEGIQTTANPARASRTRTRTARPLTSGFRSLFSDPFGLGSVLSDLDQSTFGDSAWGISTPLKTQIQIQAREEEKERKKGRKEKKMMKATSASDLRSKKYDGGLVRVRSLPVMHALSAVGDGWMEMNDYDQEIDEIESEDQDPYEQGQEEQDMDLTTPLITGFVDAGAASTTLESSEVIQLVDRRGDTTPWILDSLISPPSRFLNTQEEIEREYPDGKDESAQGQDQDQDVAGNLSSNTLSLPSSSEHNFLSFSFLLSSDARVQSRAEATTSTTTAAATAYTAKRTRSGTIVPSSHRIGNIANNINTNDPPGTRRTRSGTLVGPLPLPLAASGSGGNLSVRRTRERSGTILAGPSPVAARRTRSGIVIGCPPAPLVSTPVSVSVSGGKSTKERAPGPEIPEKYIPTTFNSDQADEHHSGFNYDENLDGFDVEVDKNGYVDVEPHIDALYIPRQCSSPDPIDFLRLAHFQDHDGMRKKHHRFGSGSGLTIEEREDEDPDLGGGTDDKVEDGMEWCLADEPPSPIVIMNKSNLGRRFYKGRILSVKGDGLGSNKRQWGEGIRNAKGKGKTTRTKFMINGREEQPDEFLVEPEEGEDSDDELLLRDGSTWYLGLEAG